MTEKIIVITEYLDRNGQEGFKIITSEQEILLSIDNLQDCCENWGYFWCNDDPQEFVGAKVLEVTLTDTALNTKKVNDEADELDAGGIMFVNIVTDAGVLQFTAYNSHNGYYGHEARVSCRQLTHSERL